MVMAVPASRIPRRLMRVMSSSRASESGVRCAHRAGKAEASAATPAVTLTAALST